MCIPSNSDACSQGCLKGNSISKVPTGEIAMSFSRRLIALKTKRILKISIIQKLAKVSKNDDQLS